MTKIILFDFDGTIADSIESFLEIINKLALTYNFLPVPTGDLEKLRSEDPKALMKKLKIPFYKIPFIASDLKKMQQQHIAHIKPINGLPEVLRTLKSKGYTLGIVTSNGKENVELFLKNQDIDIFDYIYSDTNIFGKDKVIRKFLKQNALDEKQVVYVGDEIRDIQACKKVGVKIISVTWGFNSKEGLKKYHPDFLISKPDELLEVLK